MAGPMSELGIRVHLGTDFESARQQVTRALQAEGFGVLTEIDVRATFKQKLGVDFRPYTILGACNPSLAQRALSATPEVGLLLPCNVTLTQAETGGIEVSMVDPLSLLAMVDRPELRPVAEEAQARLGRVAAALQAPGKE